MYDPTSGEILFDGQNLRHLNTRDLRGFLSLVQQEPSLLDRSILENIAHGLVNSSQPSHAHLKTALLGSDLADLAREVREGKELTAAAEARGADIVEIVALVRKAASLADADTFIVALQYGYGTVVGSSGRLVSGGQKQRVALARALVKDPAVLILDEATAALDSRSEQRIQRAIANIASGRTVLTIAHRLSTITGADNIIVMHKGRVVEEGDHAALMAKDGAYADLVKLQNLGKEAGKDETSVGYDSIRKSDEASFTGTDIEKEAMINAEVEEPRESEDQASSLAEEEDEPETPPKSLWALLRGYAPTLTPTVW